MNRQVRLLTFTMTIEVDAEDAGALGEVDGILEPYGESQVPMPGINDLAHRITDATIRTAFQYLHIAGVNAMLDDATVVVGDERDEKHPEDWFY
jgi:hypothetical protein